MEEAGVLVIVTGGKIKDWRTFNMDQEAELAEKICQEEFSKLSEDDDIVLITVNTDGDGCSSYSQVREVPGGNSAPEKAESKIKAYPTGEAENIFEGEDGRKYEKCLAYGNEVCRICGAPLGLGESMYYDVEHADQQFDHERCYCVSCIEVTADDGSQAQVLVNGMGFVVLQKYRVTTERWTIYVDSRKETWAFSEKKAKEKARKLKNKNPDKEVMFEHVKGELWDVEFWSGEDWSEDDTGVI